MIRRLLVMAALALGIIVGSAGASGAANVACAYNATPVGFGVCIGI